MSLDLIRDNHCNNQSRFKVGDEVWINYRTFSHLPEHGKLGTIVGFYRVINETFASGAVVRITRKVEHINKRAEIKEPTTFVVNIKEHNIAFEHLLLEKRNSGKIIEKWLSS